MSSHVKFGKTKEMENSTTPFPELKSHPFNWVLFVAIQLIRIIHERSRQKWKKHMTSKTYVSLSAESRMTLCLWRRPDSGDEISHPLGSPTLHAGCVIGA